MGIWFTSDLHLGHDNILRHQPNRPWESVEAMNEGLIRNVNEHVSEHDVLYVLGDFSFKVKQAQTIKLRDEIRCRNVHLVRGNHDCGWNGTSAFKTVADYVELKTDSRKIVMSHYPFLEWNGSRRGWSVMLHGHQHNEAGHNEANIEAGILRFDVGVDANDFLPVSLDTVLGWAELAMSMREADENGRA